MKSFLLLLSGLALAAAIFEDQLGEADWKVENVGVIQHAIFQEKRIVVGSEHGVLALLQQHSGAALWRHVLPRGDSLDKIVASDGQIVALCNGGTLLRSWSFASGELQWEASLVKLADPSQTLRSRAADLALDAAAGLVAALQDNCVNYVSLKTGEVAWFWCPSDDHMVLSHLVAPAGGAGDVRRAALACHVEAPGGAVEDASELPCARPVLLAARLPSKGKASGYSMEVIELAGAAALADRAVRVSDVRSAFSRTSVGDGAAAATFDLGDAVFAAASGPTRQVVYALSLSQPGSEIAEFGFDAEQAVAEAWTLQGSTGAGPQPVVSFCNPSACDVYAVDVTAGRAEKLMSCGGQAGSSAVAAVERSAAHAWGNVRGVGCSALASSGGRAATVTTSATSKVGPGSEVSTVSADVPQNKLGQSLVRSLRSAHIQVFSSKAERKQTVRSFFIGGGVGSAFATQGTRTLWSREEALSQIRQVLMIPRPEASGARAEADAAPKASLAFSARLRMQHAELLRMWGQLSRWASLEGRLMVLHLLDAESRRASLYKLSKSVGLPLSFLAPGASAVPKHEFSVIHELEKAALRESRDSTGLQFGFDKYAVVLCHAEFPGARSAEDDTQMIPAAEFLRGAAARETGVKLLALDLIHGEVAWSAEPNLDLFADHISRRERSSGAGRVQVYMKLLPGSTHRDQDYAGDVTGSPLAEGIGASLFVASMRFVANDASQKSADDVLTCVWHVDVQSGEIFGSSGAASGPTVCLPSGPGAVVGATLVDRSATAQLSHSQEEALDLASPGRVIGGAYTHLLLRHDDETVSAYPPSKSSTAPTGNGVVQYVHAFDSAQGHLTTYILQREQRRVYPSGCSAATSVAAVRCPEYAVHALGAVGTMLTRAGAEDRVVAVAYPTPHDKVISRAYVLGDKSLLLKYLNPNLVVLVSESFGGMAGSVVNASSEEKAATGDDEGSHLVVSVVDSVSGRMVYRYEIAHGGPASAGADESAHKVSVEMIEHAIVVTYWNFKAQRMELSSLMLYEGMIPKNGLGPITSLKAPAYVDVSSFSAPQPIGLQKTFVLPKTVVALDHTVTLKGLTNKHLLVGLRNGQVFRLDLRQVDPRRPLTSPTPAEKEEGLVQYNPFVPLLPQNAVTNNDTVARLSGLASSPSMALESASLVLVFGLDVFFTRVSPSKGFDMLSSEFNRPLLTIILSGMLVIVLVLRKMHKDKVIKAAWK